MKNKVILITLGVIIVALAGYFYLLKVSVKIPALSDLKCPDDYKNTADSVAAFDVWTKDFYDKNPAATLDDFNTARQEFYKNHNCTEAIKRYNDYLSGKTDPATVDMVKKVIKESGIH